VKLLKLLCATLLGSTLGGNLLASPADGLEFFEAKIRPVLANNCFGCHGPKTQMAGLNLSTAVDFLKGGDNGPVVAKGDTEKSRIIQVVGYQGKIKMPPAGKLSDEEIENLKSWVKMGAPWPDIVSGSAQNEKKERDGHAGNHFWAFQPVKNPSPPTVRSKHWVQTPLDPFILAKLEDKGIVPSAPADKLTLLRRATYDLTGLPPTEKEIQEFVSDTSPDAFPKVVDRLLASPRYGERWGRDWLDVARYADSTGADEDHVYPHAWRYRDYVIDAFNRDLPYDQFITEQLAGDLLPAAKPGEVNVKGIVATGFLALGPKPIAQQDKVKMVYDVVDEQIDVTAKAFLGLTVSCARCHDHKFDPISTKDYYSMASIFASTKSFQKIEGTVSQIYFEPLVPKEVYSLYDEHQKKVSAKKKEIQGIIDEEGARYAARLRSRLSDYMVAAWTVYQQGACAGDLATQQGLELEVLERWVKYLKPDEEVKPHLERWHQAEPTSVAAIAKEYQARFEASARDWDQTLVNWKSKVEAALKANTEPPEKPKFDAGKDRFFSEVSFGIAEPDTGNIVQPGPLTLPETGQDRVFTEDSRQRLSVLREELALLNKSSPPGPPMACAVAEGQSIQQRVFVRGSHENPGEIVPKGFPQIVAGPNPPEIRQGSGRLELARWLTDPNRPLTARVMVNRIWQWHFGEGLVRTPSNYGKMGLKPTHPELLDFLAGQFIRSGWSIKAMHRLIMLSSTYQMSSQITREKAAVDPSNELWSHFNRRRLAVEEIRDSFLCMDEALDLTMGGSLMAGTEQADGKGGPAVDPVNVKRRTVYLPLRRSNLLSLLNLFDFGDATTTSEGRTRTNVAPQALFMMNSHFILERSRSLAEYLLRAPDLDDAHRVQQAYLISLSRKPAAREIQDAVRYVDNFPRKGSGAETRLEAWQSFCQVLMASNEFIYVD
jgi:cytochrome c551/c552